MSKSNRGEHVSVIVALIALPLVLHGCIGQVEKCPDMVPIANGKVKMKCENEACTEEKVECDSGCGFGVKMEDIGKQMQFQINTAEQCVIKFTKEPPYCHKCENTANTINIDGGKLDFPEPQKESNGSFNTGSARVFACTNFNFTCDDGRKGTLDPGSYTCEESYKSESPCVFYVTFTDKNPCSNTTKIGTAQVKAVEKPKVTGDDSANQEVNKDTAPKQGESLVSIHEQSSKDDENVEEAMEKEMDRGGAVQGQQRLDHVTATRTHQQQLAVDAEFPYSEDELPHLAQLRPWAVNAHAAAYRERRP